MSSRLRGAAALVVAASTAVGLSSCAGADGSTGPAGAPATSQELTIGLLLPDTQTARYDMFDRPLFEEAVAELCAGCTVDYANAHSSVETQQQQVNAMITQGVDVLVLDAVDTAALRSAVTDAAEAGIPVVAYDRLALGPVSAYVNFNAQEIGRIQGEGLLDALGERAPGAQIVMLNSPRPTWAPTDREKAALTTLEEAGATVARSYPIADWRPETAYASMNAAMADLGSSNVAGVLAINDSIASGAIAALQASGAESLPPVVGQDAELSAVQRVIAGTQYMSVYKPYELEADAAAEMAVALGNGEDLAGVTERTADSATHQDIPAVLLDPLPLTRDTVEETVIADGMYTTDEICTPEFVAACERAGLLD
ncbi:sugar ABC transporter substrate-binding protein [Allostreptomyces psammosilenae]|uniref:D-xylose transport system substrate-binding protein n=1 Tax=Allostreptomyces psammosilenae TaxID=1892865 RepID=A0A852ZZ21_9ACTN|nr:substrate-binding domain-containing protein [Allostreptomyces psammosilenae]NYI07315.1 D-xylose transport system substrate-binding protein [Allostreptomyces psammosilenae]